MKLKEFMEKKKITVKEMAKWLGVSAGSIQAWKFGRAKINVDIALRIRALSNGEVDFEDMVSVEEEKGSGWIPPLEYLEKYRPEVLKEIEKETRPPQKAREYSKDRLLSPSDFSSPHKAG